MKKLTLDILIDLCCEATNITRKEFFSRERKRHIIVARQVFCYHASQTMKMRFVDLGKFLSQDHSTIIHAKDSAVDRVWTKDETFMPYFNHVTNILFNEYSCNTVTVQFATEDERQEFLQMCEKYNWKTL